MDEKLSSTMSLENKSLYTVERNGTSEDLLSTSDPNGWTGVEIQRVVTLAILMFTSLVGNLTIILILTCSKYSRKQMSRVNIFIVNLACGDLAVTLIVMSSELLFEISGEWKLGNVGCKMISYVQTVTLSSTTYLLMAMSWDRYQAICRPLDFNPSASRAKRTVIAAWVAAFVSALPNLLIFLQVEGGGGFECLSDGYTADWQRKVYFIWLTMSVLIIPAIWMAFCYFNLARVVWQQGNTQNMSEADGFTLLRKTGGDLRVISKAKMKTMKMSLTIVLTFVACWTPYFVVYDIRVFSDYHYSIPEAVVVLAETLALLNSSLNPLILLCFNLRIRQGLQEACSFNLCLTSHHPQPCEQSDASFSSSTILFKGIRRDDIRQPPNPRKWKGGELIFDQTTRHIQSKRSQRHEQERKRLAMEFSYLKSPKRDSSEGSSLGSSTNAVSQL